MIAEHYQGLGHIAVYTGDMDGSIAFYERIGGKLFQRSPACPPTQKRELALEMGAQFVIDPTTQDVVEEAMKITDGLGYDMVFEMSGARSAAELCPKLVGHAGTIEYFAVYPEDYMLPLNLFDMFNKEARVQFTFTNPTLYPGSIELLKVLDMDKIVGPIYEIDDAVKAFEDFKSAKYPKLLIHCNQG